MKITGRYKKVQPCFTYVYAKGTIYTIGSSGVWGCISVGDLLPYGGVLTQEEYDKGENSCLYTGTFTLED